MELVVYTRNSRLTVVITGARKRKYDHTYRTVTQDHELWGWRNIIRGIIHYKHRWRWRVIQELTERCLWPSGAWKQRSDNVHHGVSWDAGLLNQVKYHKSDMIWTYLQFSFLNIRAIRRTSLAFVSHACHCFVSAADAAGWQWKTRSRMSADDGEIYQADQNVVGRWASIRLLTIDLLLLFSLSPIGNDRIYYLARQIRYIRDAWKNGY